MGKKLVNPNEKENSRESNSKPQKISSLLKIFTAVLTFLTAVLLLNEAIIDYRKAKQIDPSAVIPLPPTIQVMDQNIAPVSSQDIPSPLITETVTTQQSTPPMDRKEKSFASSCINSTIWSVDPPHIAHDQNGCWVIDGSLFKAQDESLLIVIEDQSEQWISLYRKLPEKVDINFTILINEFSSNDVITLSFGIGNDDDVNKTGDYIIYRSTSIESPVYSGYSLSINNSSEKLFKNYTIGQKQKVFLSINGPLMDIYIDDKLIMDDITVSRSEQDHFYIMYKLPKTNSELQVFIDEFIWHEME